MIEVPSRIKGVIFDWNGTLSDDIPKVFAVAMKASARLGGKQLSYSEYRRKVRNPYLLFYRDLGCSASKKEINRWYEYYLSREKTPVRLFPDTVTVLKFLRRRSVKIGIVSSHPTAAIKSEVKGYRIGRYIDFMRGNIHIKGFHIRAFLKRYRLRPKEVIFVGDMVNDIEEGKKCGVITAAYLGGVDSKSKLLPQKPDIVLPNLLSLKRHVKFVLAKQK